MSGITNYKIWKYLGDNSVASKTIFNPNTTISSLVSSLSGVYNDFASRAGMYDTLITGLQCCTEIVDDLVDLQQSGLDVQDSLSRVIPISKESGLSLYRALVQTVNPDLGDVGHITISDANGLIYHLQVYNGGDNPNPGILVQAICGNDHYPFIRLDPNDKWNLSPVLRATNDFPEGVSVNNHVCSILSDLVQSSALNQFIQKVIGSIRSGKISQFLSEQLDEFSSKYQFIKSLFNRLCDAWCSGGLTSVINVIYNVISGTTLLSSSDDGLLVFSDNSALRPQQFLAGLLVGVGEFATSLAASVIAFFQPAISAIITALGSIGWSIVGSIVGTESETRAAFVTEEFGEWSQSLVMPMSPISLYQVQGPAPDWYKEHCDIGETLLYYPVPGGFILVGPGAYSGETITEIRAEFHPAITGANLRTVFSDSTIRDLFVYYDSNLPGTSYANLDLFKAKRNWSTILSTWVDACFDNQNTAVPMYNEGSGTMSAQADEIQRHNAIINGALFLIWASFELADDPDFWWFDTGTDHVALCKTHEFLSVSGAVDPYGVTYSTIMYLLAQLSVPSSSSARRINYDALSWSNIITLYQCEHTYNDVQFDLLEFDVYSIPLNYVSTFGFDKAYHADLLNYDGSLGPSVPIVGNVKYGILMPKYDANSYWFWVISSAVITAALIAVTIVAVVKIRNAIRAKRAANVSNFNDKNEAYQMAVNGQRLEYNEQTHQYDTIEFDVNSAEGKAYIKSCWTDLKRVSLKNNLWANLFGGTKYDPTTFWGEAEEDSGSIVDTVKEKISGLVNGDDASTDDTTVNATDYSSASLATYELICGDVFRPDDN